MMNHIGQECFRYRVNVLEENMNSWVGVNIQQFTKMLGLIIFNVTLLKIPLYIFEEEKLSMFCEMNPG